MKRWTLGFLAALTLAAGQASPAGVVNLSTGLDASNNLITTGGQADAHWTVDQLTGGIAPAQVVEPNNADSGFPSWYANGPNSAWIARDANTASNGPAPYTYYRTFTLTAADLATAAISGTWAIDDTGTLNLNGNQVGALGSGNWFSPNPFSVAAGSSFFQVGLNTLSMTMTTTDNFLEGARLEGKLTGVQAAPEPSALVLAGAGALIILGYRRRRVSSAA